MTSNVYNKDCPDRKYVVVIADGFQPAYIREIVNALARNGLRICLIGGNIHDNQDYAKNVRFLNYREDDSPTRPTLTKIHDLIVYYFRLIVGVRRARGYTILKAGIGRPLLDDIIINLIFKLLGKKIIHIVHNVLPHGRSDFKNRLLYEIVYRWIANYLIVHTEAQRTCLCKEFRIPTTKITLAPHGTYHIEYRSEHSKSVFRKRYKLAHDDFVVLSFGYQRQYKGTHLLVEAMEKIAIPRPRLLIRGSAEGEYAHRLTSLISERRLDECVDCKFGYVSEEEMRDLFIATDIVALPYLEGSQSGVLFMAYAYGRPVLASNVGGFPDYITAGVTGELFQTGEVNALANALVAARQNRDGYDAELIRQYAYRNYSWEVFAERIIREIYARSGLES